MQTDADQILRNAVEAIADRGRRRPDASKGLAMAERLCEIARRALHEHAPDGYTRGQADATASVEIDRSDWMGTFTAELQQMRFDLSLRTLQAVATLRWAADRELDPRLSAWAYHASNGVRCQLARPLPVRAVAPTA